MQVIRIAKCENRKRAFKAKTPRFSLIRETGIKIMKLTLHVLHRPFSWGDKWWGWGGGGVSGVSIVADPDPHNQDNIHGSGSDRDQKEDEQITIFAIDEVMLSNYPKKEEFS